MKLKWTRDHKSLCGRFWCYKPPRSDEWQLWDRETKDHRGNVVRYTHRHLSSAKEHAQRLVSGN